MNNACILYDADGIAYAENDLFEPQRLAARGWLQGAARGRGEVHFFRYDEVDYVLRHYRRGGRVARLKDRYLWIGLDRSRAWREWHLLARMTALDLPAPRPLAARVVRHGAFYRADLITVRIPDALSLAEKLKTAALPASAWCEIGRVIASFHAAGVWHADLNAHNVLLDIAHAVAVIDFDRARFRRRAMRWQRANLARLLRSLRKLKRLHPGLHFRESDFQELAAGYDERMGV